MLWPLLLGNFFIGTGVLAPAGLISELSAAFQVDATAVASLLAYGGAVLCVESPLLAYATHNYDRRQVLCGALLIFALGHMLSLFASQFAGLLLIRLVMIAAAALFTPQAASALALYFPAHQRAAAITFVFLGWSLASAVGIPLAKLCGSLVGWRVVYATLALGCLFTAYAVKQTLPQGLHGKALSLASWIRALTDRNIWSILAISSLALSSHHSKYPYIVVDLATSLNPSPALTAALLAIYGGASIVGISLATRIIAQAGPAATANIFLGVTGVGMLMWTTMTGSLPIAMASLLIWGSGISPFIAAQQARLVSANPATASTSISLNTSVVYLGQAIGTSWGASFLVTDATSLPGWMAIIPLLAALMLSLVLAARQQT